MLNSGVSSSLYDISYIENNIATAVGDSGVILRTIDGGVTWSPQYNPEIPRYRRGYHRLNSISYVDRENGTIVGDFDIILRTTDGGVLWVEDERPAPTLFHLGQNYPNPVNASTTIPFTLTKPEHVTLGVYDMLGREVAVLVDEWRDAGTYTARFDGASLPSGVYFYVLRIGSAVETRKLLLTNTHATF